MPIRHPLSYREIQKQETSDRLLKNPQADVEECISFAIQEPEFLLLHLVGTFSRPETRNHPHRIEMLKAAVESLFKKSIPDGHTVRAHRLMDVIENTSIEETKKYIDAAVQTNQDLTFRALDHILTTQRFKTLPPETIKYLQEVRARLDPRSHISPQVQSAVRGAAHIDDRPDIERIGN